MARPIIHARVATSRSRWNNGVSVEPAERDAREALLAGGKARLHGVGTPVPARPLRGALVLGLRLTWLGAVRMRLLGRTNSARPGDSSSMMATA